MNKYELVKIIEDFAPLETQEKWDCSGWLVDNEGSKDVNKVMLALTITEDVVKQAIKTDCDMVISHHPLFFVPFGFFRSTIGRGSSCASKRATNASEGLNLYCAHTNLDKAENGTTDTLIESLFPRHLREREEFFRERSELRNSGEGYLRFIHIDINIHELLTKLKTISPNLRYTNPKNTTEIKTLAFCAGSGSEFIQEAFEYGADAVITGDLKFHTALDSPIAVFDVGHFESEIMVLDTLEKLLTPYVEIIKANEQSPFIYG